MEKYSTYKKAFFEKGMEGRSYNFAVRRYYNSGDWMKHITVKVFGSGDFVVFCDSKIADFESWPCAGSVYADHSFSSWTAKELGESTNIVFDQPQYLCPFCKSIHVTDPILIRNEHDYVEEDIIEKCLNAKDWWNGQRKLRRCCSCKKFGFKEARRKCIDWYRDMGQPFFKIYGDDRPVEIPLIQKSIERKARRIKKLRAPTLREREFFEMLMASDVITKMREVA